MRIEICNERLLSRFGVDRLLLIAAEHFRDLGAQVRLTALRSAPDLVAATRLPIDPVVVPRGVDLAAAERFATRATLARWLTNGTPDAVLIGGWPFFDLAARAPALGVASLFVDAGAVPHEGLKGAALVTQQDVRRIRAATLPHIQRILPISRFIAQSQTVRERGHTTGVATVLLGADHLPPPRISADDVGADLLRRRARGQRLVLHLGRFEARGYKGSPDLYDFLRQVRTTHDAAALVLAEDRELTVPADLERNVVALGRPDDAEMRHYMSLADLGVSFSRWEGFNLPLAEMQEAGKPAFVLSVGAHPEVVADPLLLCIDTRDMAERAGLWLAGDAAFVSSVDASIRRWRGSMPWSRTLDLWTQQTRAAITELGATRRRREPAVFTDRLDDGGTAVLMEWDAAGEGYRLSPLDRRAGIAGTGDALDAVIAARHPHAVGPPVARLSAEPSPAQRRWLARRGIVLERTSAQ